MKTETFESFSENQTYELGKRVGMEAAPGQVITLNGDLGCGKTVFTKGFAAGLGVAEAVSSPTFTILKIYEGGRLPMYHFDVYRIGDSEEMFETGWDEYVCRDGVCLIEWADIIEDLILELPPEKVMRIEIGKDLTRGPDYRSIVIKRK